MGGVMGSVDLPYLNIYTVKGKRFGYYRRGGKRVRLKGDPGTPEFLESYNRAHADAEMAALRNSSAAVEPRDKAIEGTLRHLVEAFEASPDFKEKGKKTQVSYLWAVKWLLPKFGDGKVALMTREWVIRRRDELGAETPGKANAFLRVISLLLTWGIDRGYCKTNVAARIKKLRAGESYRVWTDAEIAAFTGPEAGRMTLPVLMALYTGQRQGDILKMPWSAYDGQFIRLKQSKAGRKARVMEIPVHPVLKAEIDAAPQTAITICTRADGHSWKQRHFGAAFAAKRKKLGLSPDVHFHGLRHTNLSWLSELGASDAEMQAVGGHKTKQMLGLYTQDANQKKLAISAIARLPVKRTF